MGVFKEIFNNFLSKFNLDVDGTIDKDGVQFSITRKEVPKDNLELCQLGIAGYGNPFGGVVVTVFTSENKIMLHPKLRDDSAIFVCLNGMLLPKEKDVHGTVLWDYLKDKSDNNPPAGISKKFYRTVTKKLDNDMTVTYWHIPASEMQEYVNNADGKFNEDLFFEVVSDHIVQSMLPDDMAVGLVVDPTNPNPFLHRLNTMVDIDFPAEREKVSLEYDTGRFSTISESLTYYIYVNILNDTKKEVEEKLKIKLGDIPVSPNGQKEFLEALERMLKPDVWDQLVENWVV